MTALESLNLTTIKILKYLNWWWCGCSGLKFAVLYVKTASLSRSVVEPGWRVIRQWRSVRAQPPFRVSHNFLSSRIGLAEELKRSVYGLNEVFILFHIRIVRKGVWARVVIWNAVIRLRAGTSRTSIGFGGHWALNT